VVAPVGIFLGRCANFINGELYGKPATVPWAVLFPRELPMVDEGVMALIRTDAEVRGAIMAQLVPRHPSQLYAAMLEGLLLFLVLWLLRTRLRLPDGLLTGAFFVLYAAGRIVGEIFREPDASLIAGLSRGQFYSLFMVVIGIVFLAVAFRKGGRWRPG